MGKEYEIHKAREAVELENKILKIKFFDIVGIMQGSGVDEEVFRKVYKIALEVISEKPKIMMDTFLKFLEENCPGDDAHSGGIELNKPLLDRCGMCAEIYAAHKAALAAISGEQQAIIDAAIGLIKWHGAGALKSEQYDRLFSLAGTHFMGRRRKDEEDPDCPSCNGRWWHADSCPRL